MGSICEDIIGIFHWHNPSGRIMALGSTQPLTKMSTRNISCGVKAGGWQPYHLHVLTVSKSRSLNLLEPSGPVQACNEIAFAFTTLKCLASLAGYFIHESVAYVVCLISIQLRVQWVLGGSFLRGKMYLKLEADDTPPSNAKFNITYRDSFTVYITLHCNKNVSYAITLMFRF